MKFLKIIQLPRQLLWAVVMEGVGTTRMVHVYARHGSGKLRLTPLHRHPTPAELHVAGEQLKDIPRSLLFLAVFLIPVPGFIGGYALAAISLEKKYGNKIKLLPSRFRHLLSPEKKK
ncbi:MAG: hypothetical protein H7246_01425 [Phycisphaerae bacterium]|nr:hypothetical protein [Saprospiraceae bacterium]